MLILLAGGASRGDDRKLDCLGKQSCIAPQGAGKSLGSNTLTPLYPKRLEFNIELEVSPQSARHLDSNSQPTRHWSLSGEGRDHSHSVFRVALERGTCGLGVVCVLPLSSPGHALSHLGVCPVLNTGI